MFKGIHYGKEVWLNWVNEEENALKQVINAMKKQNIQFELLPIYDKEDIYHEDMIIDVLKYKNNGEKYCIISGLKSCYCITKRLPDDMDLPKLINDLLGQNRGKEPMLIGSKFKKLLGENMVEAQNIIAKADFDAIEKWAISLFRAKSEDTMSDEEKEVDEESFGDEDPVEERTMFLYLYKVIADCLERKGCDYSDMILYAELDHHDTDTWENDLEWLYDGFYWRSTLQKYEEEARKYLEDQKD